MRSRRAIVFIGVCALLASCGEEKRSAEQDDIIAPERGRGSGYMAAATDNTEPALWLARLEAGAAIGQQNPGVERLRAAWLSARAHLLESDRMIANRTAQVGQMLAADGRSEDFGELINALVDVAAVAGQKQTYGELCQHYYNLRHSGVARDAALQMLAGRYRIQKQFR